MSFPATFQDIQASVIKKLRLSTANDTAAVKDWINAAYADAAMETEYFQTAAQITLTANSSVYTLPAAIGRMKSLTIRPAGGTAYGRELEEVNLSRLQELRYTGAVVASGDSATRYALVGAQQLELWPVPQSADILRVYYVYLPTPLSANGDFPVFPEPYGSKVLEYGALAEAAEFLEDPGENNFRQMSLYWQRKLRQHKNRIASGGATWQLQIKNQRRRPTLSNDIDVRYG